MKILIIEDDEQSACMLQQLLELEHEIKVAHNGTQAIEIGLTFEPGLVISDWKLEGGMDGVEACRQILAQHETTIVFLSGSPLLQLKVLSEALSPLDFLSKPVNFKKLSSLIHDVERSSTEIKL